jgi:hypothetical protein
MTHELATAFRLELDRARTFYAVAELARAFACLERAHVLGQRYFRPHLVTHWWMLKVALRQRSGRETFGQVLRCAAVVPGYLFGWVPRGNTGGANVSPILPMPVTGDLAPLVAGHDVWADVRRRTMLWAAAGTVALAVRTIAIGFE